MDVAAVLNTFPFHFSFFLWKQEDALNNWMCLVLQIMERYLGVFLGTLKS